MTSSGRLMGATCFGPARPAPRPAETDLISGPGTFWTPDLKQVRGPRALLLRVCAARGSPFNRLASDTEAVLVLCCSAVHSACPSWPGQFLAQRHASPAGYLPSGLSLRRAKGGRAELPGGARRLSCSCIPS